MPTDRRRFLSLLAGAALAPTDALRALAVAPRYRSAPELDPSVVQVIDTALGNSSDLIFVSCASGKGQPGPMIIDRRGSLVWFRPRPGLTVMNFGPHTLAGEPVLAWWEGQSEGGHGAGEFVLAGRDYRELARLRAGGGLSTDFHEFSITSRDTALLTAYETVGPLLDSVVQEIDIATGTVLLEWRASERIGLDETFVSPATGPFDFAHLNAAAVDDDGHLLISSRHTWTVYKVDRSSGDIIWRLGGKKSDFEIDDAAMFQWQHHVRRHRDGTFTVFDNGAGVTDSAPFSRALRLELDETARTATLKQQAVHPDRLLASAMGSVELLDDDGMFVGWGSVPRFSEFAGDGTIRFDAGFPGGGFTYRAFRRAWDAAPATRPSFVVAGGRGYASWNGATAVAAWRLRSGGRSRAVVAKRSFETRIPLPATRGWAAVDALDAHGRTLASSPAIRI